MAVSPRPANRALAATRSRGRAARAAWLRNAPALVHTGCRVPAPGRRRDSGRSRRARAWPFVMYSRRTLAGRRPDAPEFLSAAHFAPSRGLRGRGRCGRGLLRCGGRRPCAESRLVTEEPVLVVAPPETPGSALASTHCALARPVLPWVMERRAGGGSRSAGIYSLGKCFRRTCRRAARLRHLEHVVREARWGPRRPRDRERGATPLAEQTAVGRRQRAWWGCSPRVSSPHASRHFLSEHRLPHCSRAFQIDLPLLKSTVVLENKFWSQNMQDPLNSASA